MNIGGVGTNLFKLIFFSRDGDHNARVHINNGEQAGMRGIH